MSTVGRIGFIGAGRMAAALARGWLAAELTTLDRLSASDPLPAARDAFSADTGIRPTADNASVLAASDIIILAVKPQTMPAILAELRPLLQPQHLVVSVAAGITLGQLLDGLGASCRLVRVMTNMPCLIGAGASGYTPDGTATVEDIAVVDRLLNAVGRGFRLPEHLLDAVTGLSGSGPAFVAVIIEALADGGVRVGLPRDVALALAAQTVLGTARMVLETNLHPAVLKDAVASPGGTTIAGLHALERGGLRAALMDAVESATRRATELGTTQPG
ncbi:MAG TPA: pyrroline-5-carboxylate reductase [Gemmataceae bacterium]|nr:pyrroline-5-carboxylate reductase [Gemmataceae bacterium]